MTSNPPREYTAEELHLAEKLQPIRLALKIAESLLARGVSTRDTVSQALDVTERYCKERVYFDVSSNVIIASQYRGLHKDPLTLMVTVQYGAANNMIVQDLQQLVRDIVRGLPLSDALARYEQIETANKHYPQWLRTIGNAGMATGIVMLYTNSWINIVLTFVVACFVDICLSLLGRRRIPPFFGQAAATMVIVLLAAIFAGAGQAGVEWLEGANPSIIVVGGIMTLVAGLSLAATAQDAIDEYYITASARFVKTAMMTVGIMAGIVAGVTIVDQLSEITINTTRTFPPSPLLFQFAGAGIAAAAWAIYMQSQRAAIIWSALVAMGGYAIYLYLSPSGPVVASAIASVAIGFSASVVARFFRSPSIAIINSSILMLVPGYMLYRGLMHFIGASSANNDFLEGLMTTTLAITVALAIAAGAALGTYIGRPVRSHIIRLYAYAPSLFERSPIVHAKPSLVKKSRRKPPTP